MGDSTVVADASVLLRNSVAVVSLTISVTSCSTFVARSAEKNTTLSTSTRNRVDPFSKAISGKRVMASPLNGATSASTLACTACVVDKMRSKKEIW